MHDLHEMAAAARAAYLTLASADASARNRALLAMADALLSEKDMIFAENAVDVRLAQEINCYNCRTAARFLNTGCPRNLCGYPERSAWCRLRSHESCAPAFR